MSPNTVREKRKACYKTAGKTGGTVAYWTPEKSKSYGAWTTRIWAENRSCGTKIEFYNFTTSGNSYDHGYQAWVETLDGKDVSHVSSYEHRLDVGARNDTNGNTCADGRHFVGWSGDDGAVYLPGELVPVGDANVVLTAVYDGPLYTGLIYDLNYKGHGIASPVGYERDTTSVPHVRSNTVVDLRKPTAAETFLQL